MKRIIDFISILMDARRLDVFDAHHYFSNERVRVLEIVSNSMPLPRRGVFIRVLFFVLKWGRSLFRRRTCGSRIAKNSILAPYLTNNQYVAMLPVVDRLDGAFLIHIGDDHALSFKSLRCRTFSLFFFFNALQDFVRATSYQRSVMEYFFDEYWNSYGYYILCRLYLRAHEPSAVLVSNDHSLLIRTIILAADDAGIPTVYMQHAALSNVLPPSIFNFAFLEGINSLRQCLENGETDTEIYVSGIPRMDFSFNKKRERKEISVLGVAVNALDDLSVAENMCRRLKAQYPDKRLIFRPHPLLRARFSSLKAFCMELDVEFSNPLEESANDFLCKLDLLVSGESNIHLEAALLNILSLYFTFGGERRDHYGFLVSGMIFECETMNSVMTQIDDAEITYPNVRSRSKGYCGTIGTQYDGRSAELIARTLQNVVWNDGVSAQNDVWVVSDECNHAFVLRDEVE